MRPRTVWHCALVTALLAALAGCSGPGGATVSGSVTYGGVPVEEGSIQFTPKDGKGAVTGGPIVGGKFRVANVGVGPMAVFVSSNAGPDPATGGGPVTTEDLANAAKERKAGKKKDAPAKVAVPPDAVGNNVTFDVKAGANTLAIDLTAPGAKPPAKN